MLRRALLLAVLGFGMSCRPGPIQPPQLESIARRIDDLRCAANFELALQLAEAHERDLVEARAADWRITDARRQSVTLRRLSSLPEAARSEWAESARSAFTVPTDSVINSAATQPAIERWVEVCGRWVGRDSPEVATALSELALYHERRNHLLRAYELDQQAFEIRVRAFGPQHPDIAASLDRMSFDLKRATGVSSTVLELCERALEMRRQLCGEGSREVAASLHRRGNYRRMRADMRGALEDFAAAEAIFTRTNGASSHAVAEVLADRGLTLATDEKWRQAEPLLQRALAIRRTLGGPPDELLAFVLDQLGVVLRELRRSDEAATLLQECAAVQEQRWRAAAPDRARADLFTLVSQRDLALLALQQGRWTDAWIALERLSSRVTVDAAIARGELVAGADPWLDLLPRVQNALPDSTAMIGWLDSRYGGRVPDWPFWCFVIRKTGEPRWFHAEAPPGGTASLAMQMVPFVEAMHAVADWPLKLETGDQLEELGHEMYRMRLAPMAPALEGIRTLIISSSDTNYGVPVEAMVDDRGRFIGEQFVTVYSPSALLYASAQERKQAQSRRHRWRGLLVGAPAGDGATSLWDSLPPLQKAADEIAGIALQMDAADVFIGARASERSLDSLHANGKLEQYDFIHFATHAYNHSDWTNHSALLLAEARSARGDLAVGAAPIIDGWLTTGEIGNRWRLRAGLVSLAACRGSSHRVSIANGPTGIGSAFLEAGAHSILVSTYPIDDEASDLFFRHFASLVFAADGPALEIATALQRTRLWLRDYRAPDGSRPYSSPAVWSAFILLGWPD